jgi:hypothetical protein
MGITLLNNSELRVAIDAGKRLVFEGKKEMIARSIGEFGTQLGDQWASGEFRQKALLVLLDRLLADGQVRKETK